MVCCGAVAVGVIGEICSSATVAAAGFAGERKVPLISPASSSPQLTGMPFFRRTVPSDRWVGAGVARTMRLLCAHCMYAMCTPSCGTHAYASYMQRVISCGADESVHTALTLNIIDSPTSPAAVFAPLQVLPTTVASCTPPPLSIHPDRRAAYLWHALVQRGSAYHGLHSALGCAQVPRSSCCKPGYHKRV
jgi:hypothetical protein